MRASEDSQSPISGVFHRLDRQAAQDGEADRDWRPEREREKVFAQFEKAKQVYAERARGSGSLTL